MTTQAAEKSEQGRITMYTTTWCGFCRRLKTQLGRDGIEMVEVDIERDPKAAEFVMSVNGGNQTVPTVVIRTPDAGEVVLTNPSAKEVKRLIGA
ncbi:glutaredoxin domain-containing protein [Actinomadura rupiterrae]|uniref:glutaredoxin domain-containing protein n=1 Tax=Actinomadura rupiterrae TaxID=559627 RepID=UPI0020A30869|nr:glutaredoxin domain-containing protein [Actinomadura rupiterrae]MCP2336455.1 mycoredoxin [Actinomadura rupiterrae]